MATVKKEEAEFKVKIENTSLKKAIQSAKLWMNNFFEFFASSINMSISKMFYVSE